MSRDVVWGGGGNAIARPGKWSQVEPPPSGLGSGHLLELFSEGKAGLLQSCSFPTTAVVSTSLSALP